MSDVIRSNLLYTNQTMEEVLSNTHFTLCANNHREIFVQKHNPILDIREVRYEFNKLKQGVDDKYYFVSCDLNFVKPNKAKIRFKKYNPEEICV